MANKRLYLNSTDVVLASFVQATDPSLDTPNQVLAGKLWIDTTGGGWVWKRRSPDNLSWITKASGTAAWGGITGTLGSQTDLQNEFNRRVSVGSLGTANGVATLGADAKVPPAQLPATTIADGSITTLKIADKNVTLAKIQDVAANKLLGRAGTLGSAQEITLGTNLTLDSVTSTLNAAGGTSTISDGSVTTLKLADKAATFGKMQDVAANKIIGRIGTLGGVMQEIALGTNLSFDSTNLTLNAASSSTSTSGGNLIATSAYASLEAAFAAINATATPLTTLMVNSVVPLTIATAPPATIAQPANIFLYFVGGGRVNKTTATTLTALNYGCDDEYQICFTGFAAGDLKFGLKMPTKVSYCNFGAVAYRFGGDIVAAMAGIDTIPAVDLVANALTFTTQDGMPQGTTGYFPQGDFNFSKAWINTKALTISGTESNTYWEKATRLFFPRRSHGIMQRRQRDPVSGTFVSRSIGNIMKNFEVVQDHRFYTDSTIKMGGRKDFAPLDVNVTADTITLTGHLYDTGEKVTYSATVGWANPLNDYSGDYYVIKIDANTIKLATSYANAIAGTAIDITSQGSGVHRIVSWEMRYVGGGLIGGTHVADEDFGFPLNDGATITFDDSRSIMVLRERRTQSYSSPAAGNTLTGSFTQRDVGADIVGPNTDIREAKILTVAADGLSATINVNTSGAFTGQGFYVNTARSLEIVKPIFVLRTYEGATSAAGHNSFIHNGKWLVGQPIRFYHPSGDRNQDFFTTVTSVSTGNGVFFADPIPARFGGGLFTTCEAQGLAPITNEKVRLNKWSAIHIEEYNYGQVERVRTKNFAGNGFTVTTDPQMQYLKGNANMVSFQDCFSDGCAANGISLSGQDSNACRITNMNVPNTGGYGLRDDTYLGCTVNEGHFADCNMGVMWTAGAHAQQLRSKETTKTAVHDVYVEGGSVGFNLGTNTAIFGGVLDCGFHPQSRHTLAMSGNTPIGDIAISGGIGWAGMNKLWSARINARPVNKFDTYFLKAGGNTPVSYDVVNDWALGAGNLGNRGYVGIPNGNPGVDYILAWDFAKRAVLTRGELQVGDGSSDPNLYSGMISGTAAPTTGSYPKGYMVWNRNPISGGTIGWVNVGDAVTATWRTFGTISAT